MSRLAFWVSDPDDAIGEAESAQEETVGRDYREDEGLAGAEERFGIPITHAVIGR